MVSYRIFMKLCCTPGLEHLDIEPKPESLLDFDVSEYEWLSFV